MRVRRPAAVQPLGSHGDALGQAVQSFHTFLDGLAGTGLSGCDILVLTTYVDDAIDRQIRLLRMAGNSVDYLMLQAQEVAS